MWITGWANMAFLLVVTVVYLSFGESLVRTFTSEPGVVAAGAEAVRIWSYGYLAVLPRRVADDGV